jgi:hypothetical protein
LIPRCLVLVVGVQGVEDPKGVSTVPSTTLNCSSSRCNCLCGPPLSLPSQEALADPYAFGRTPHSPVWVEECSGKFAYSGVKGDSTVSGRHGMGRVFRLSKPIREPTSGLEPLSCSLRVCGQWLLGVAGVCKFGISKGFSVPCIAHHCRMLRAG